MRRGNTFTFDSRIKQALQGEEQVFIVANAKRIQKLAERSMAGFSAAKLAAGTAAPDKVTAKN